MSKKPRSNPRRKKLASAPITSAAELARRVGVHRSQVTRWIADPRWAFGSAPWSADVVAKVVRWRADNLESDIESDDEGGDADLLELKKTRLREDIRRLRAAADQSEMALTRERKELLPTDEVAACIAEVLHMVKTRLLGMSSHLSPQLDNQPASVAEELIDAHAREVLRDFSDAFDRVARELTFQPLLDTTTQQATPCLTVRHHGATDRRHS